MPKENRDKSNRNKTDIDPGPESDPFVLFKNYSKQCESIGISYNESVKRALCFNENDQGSSQLLIGDESENPSFKPLGAWGMRALVSAILGNCNHINATKYTALKEIRIWRSDIGDHGAMAIAKLLRQAGPEFNISFVELSDNNIGYQGAHDLGRSLCAGMMKSLVNLNLDYNSMIGSNGITAIAKGLCTNSTLKQLSLRYCNIDEDGGEPLNQILSAPKTAITTIDLTGNLLGGKGLAGMSHGVKVNSTIQKLNLSDNNILPRDIDSITIFSDSIKDHNSLTEINLLYNSIGEEGGLTLISSIERNKRIISFLVDTSLPPDIYSALTRIPAKGKLKAKKKKKKKK